jgi:hypothetical protein
MSTLRTGFLLATALQILAACDEWSLAVNSDGLLFISIISENGEIDRRYRVRAREADGSTQVLEIPPSGQLSSSSLDPGMVELTLLSPPGCTVSSQNPQSLMVREGRTTRVAFDVVCQD